MAIGLIYPHERIKNMASPFSILNGMNGYRFLSQLLFSALISLQSLFIFPASGQNGISVYQPESVRTESIANQAKKKKLSYSFIKLFFELNATPSQDKNRREEWRQNLLNYSLKIDQTLLSLVSLPAPPGIYLRCNICHQNTDEFPLNLLS